MTVSAEIHIHDGANTVTKYVTGRTKAEDDVRFKFNPSALDSVTEIKAPGVLWLSKIDQLSELSEDPETKRLLAAARTQFQGASMFAVPGVTHGL